jgi:hypothetical protein
MVSVLSREKWDETIGNFSCLAEWSALMALGSRCPIRQSSNHVPPDLPDLGPAARLDNTVRGFYRLAHRTVADRGPAPGRGEVLGRCSG